VDASGDGLVIEGSGLFDQSSFWGDFDPEDYQ